MAAAYGYKLISDKYGHFTIKARELIDDYRSIEEEDVKKINTYLRFGLQDKFWSDKLVDSKSFAKHYRKVKAAYKKANQ